MGTVTDAAKELASDVRRWVSQVTNRGGDAAADAVAPQLSARDAALAAIVIFAVRFITRAAGLFREQVPVTEAALDAAVVAVPVFVLMVVIFRWRGRRFDRTNKGDVDRRRGVK